MTHRDWGYDMDTHTHPEGETDIEKAKKTAMPFSWSMQCGDGLGKTDLFPPVMRQQERREPHK